MRVTNYQCPSCTGPLHYDSGIGKLKCDFCGSVYENAAIEALYAEKDASAEAAHAKVEQQGLDAWDTSRMSAEWGEDAQDIRVYNCPSCGAELVCDANTAATACPYCDNPTIVPGKLGGSLKPDYVIPFALKKEDAIAALKKHYEGRPFLPKVFKDENHLDEIKGVYVPFWLFDGEASGTGMYEGLISRTYRRGDYRVTETAHYDVYRAGSVAFSRIPVDASKRMADDYMDSLEPYDYGELKPFSKAYLPGFFADKFDDTVEECGHRADTRAQATLAELLRGSVMGYEGVMERGCDVSLKRGRVSYALLPVWILNTTWNGQRFLFAMNGQTGKFVGDLPSDKALRRSMALKVFGISFVACLGLAIGLGLGDLLAVLGGAA